MKNIGQPILPCLAVLQTLVPLQLSDNQAKFSLNPNETDKQDHGPKLEDGHVILYRAGMDTSAHLPDWGPFVGALSQHLLCSTLPACAQF